MVTWYFFNVSSAMLKDTFFQEIIFYWPCFRYIQVALAGDRVNVSHSKINTYIIIM